MQITTLNKRHLYVLWTHFCLFCIMLKNKNKNKNKNIFNKIIVVGFFNSSVSTMPPIYKYKCNKPLSVNKRARGEQSTKLFLSGFPLNNLTFGLCFLMFTFSYSSLKSPFPISKTFSNKSARTQNVCRFRVNAPLHAKLFSRYSTI